MLRKLVVSDFLQFDEISINFHPRLTVLTGVNGSGKSTLLNLLPLVGRKHQHVLPQVKEADGQRVRKWTSSVAPGRSFSDYENIGHLVVDQSSRVSQHSPLDQIIRVDLTVAPPVGPQFGNPRHTINVSGSPYPIPGFHIASERSPVRYKPIESVPTERVTAKHAFDQFFAASISARLNENGGEYALSAMKTVLIAMAILSSPSDFMEGDETAAALFRDFQDAVRLMLPPEIGFREFRIDLPDVVIRTTGGDFLLESASNGTLSIIELAWLIFFYSRANQAFTVSIDEPELHLHPALQRTVMSGLVTAFPTVQFIVATHSPFIISSVRDAHVYVLRHQVSRKPSTLGNVGISSLRLESNDASGTANEILREVLGVNATIPIWAEQELKTISDGLQADELNPESIRMLRNKLEAAGLGSFYPEALAQVAARK